MKSNFLALIDVLLSNISSASHNIDVLRDHFLIDHLKENRRGLITIHQGHVAIHQDQFELTGAC